MAMITEFRIQSYKMKNIKSFIISERINFSKNEFLILFMNRKN